MSIVPLPGCMVTDTLTMAAIWPAQAPAHETTKRGVMRVRLPERSSRSVAATIRSPSRSISTSRWYDHASLPSARASAMFDSMSCQGSTEPSGSLKARRMAGFRAGSRRSASATGISSQSTSAAKQAAGKAVT